MTQDAAEEFEKEAKTMFNLSHPNTTRLYGVCLEKGKYSMVMEYLPKGSLYNVLHSKESLSWTQRWQISIDIGKGILHLHSKNILHRDLKSLNILLDDQLHAKVSDFGLSVVKKETTLSSSKKNSNQEVGTLPWMAPELFNGEKYMPYSDIFSYGVILWEIATREMPYVNFMSPYTLISFVQQGKRQDIPKETPPSFAKLISRCWDERAEERPTINEAVEYLEKTQNEEIFSYAKNMTLGFMSENREEREKKEPNSNDIDNELERKKIKKL
jgi:serine/threonine protein kinase